jgi:hypothetical protein
MARCLKKIPLLLAEPVQQGRQIAPALVRARQAHRLKPQKRIQAMQSKPKIWRSFFLLLSIVKTDDVATLPALGVGPETSQKQGLYPYAAPPILSQSGLLMFRSEITHRRPETVKSFHAVFILQSILVFVLTSSQQPV